MLINGRRRWVGYRRLPSGELRLVAQESKKGLINPRLVERAEGWAGAVFFCPKHYDYEMMPASALPSLELVAGAKNCEDLRALRRIAYWEPRLAAAILRGDMEKAMELLRRMPSDRLRGAPPEVFERLPLREDPKLLARLLSL